MSHTSTHTDAQKINVTLSMQTQMKWTNDCIGEGWEMITGSSSGGPSPGHPRYGERLHTIRVDETCPHYQAINARFNSGTDNCAISTEAGMNVQTSLETLCEILRYALADGRFGIRLHIHDTDVDGQEVQNLGLPKSVAKDDSKKKWIGEGDCFDCDIDTYMDKSNWGRVDGVLVSYKVNGSTGERNETGEKRVNRVLKALDKYL